MQNSILSLLKAGGSESENDYPYEAKSVDCRFDASKVKVKVIGCHAYDLKSAETLKQLLYHNGPIVIGVRGNPLQAYVSGIMNEESCEGGNLNHAVLLVGYGVENNVPFWTVKNSWGLTFGEKGYFRVKRGEHINSCGMMNNAMCSAVVA
ncbi:unnamed protein product [Chrysodeixis includens]|uniref:Peptidase C1A papain C-terminal domain-containing protein n=1 Tax=Chrysodeixis includens TaxID=689277 RepID=A0A9N8PXD2_CHRIL|nr:unnamed protein product [Chrysodeixis includens]